LAWSDASKSGVWEARTLEIEARVVSESRKDDSGQTSSPQKHGSTTTEAELRELVAVGGAILHNQELVDYLGHCSARLPGSDRVIIKPKHSPRTRSPERLSGADMIVIDLDGNLIEGDERPPAESFIHTEIYRARTDVTAVVHTHQPAATLLGVVGGELRPVLHVPSVLAGKGHVSKWDCPLLVTDQDLGRQLSTALGSADLCHLTGHGIVSVADDLRLAVVRAIAFEQLAQANLTILQTGLEPRVITPQELDILSTTMASIDGRWAYYLERLTDAPDRR
jgi:L-ribulose-5-phosphate 4-epimerase